MNREFLHALNALQLHETAQRYTRSTGGEAEHLGSFFPVERFQGSPEPDDNRIGTGVAVVLRSSSPFVDVDIGGTRNQQLKLLLVEL